MEEILLRSDPREEPAIDKPPRSRAGVVGEEGGQEATAGHEGRTLSLQLNLTQQAGDLHAIHLHTGNGRMEWKWEENGIKFEIGERY